MTKKRDTNIFTKISVELTKTKVPPLFSTGLSTTYVLKVSNSVTNYHFAIGKTYSDFLLLRNQLLRDMDDSHVCDNVGCRTFVDDSNVHFPPKVIMHRNADVIRNRELKFQDFLDYLVHYINGSRESSCSVARENVPNALIVFLFDGAKMNKRKFWIPAPRHHARRIPQEILDQAFRLAKENKEEEHIDDEALIGRIQTILESHGGQSFVVENSEEDGSVSPGKAIEIGTPFHLEDNNDISTFLPSFKQALSRVDDPNELVEIEHQLNEMIAERKHQLLKH
ncbi:hypothetical protein THRCLA_06587 [Thraustotheca clavata]|uniref:PX domain-containing protein n=1 Tax=Thraustotheca clavata TaxID=74557 RepID=A0A1V9ZMF0_9STRA|nr:hypothetical protein THRCLA_06587 [Thraustotheca clavata]